MLSINKFVHETKDVISAYSACFSHCVLKFIFNHFQFWKWAFSNVVGSHEWQIDAKDIFYIGKQVSKELPVIKWLNSNWTESCLARMWERRLVPSSSVNGTNSSLSYFHPDVSTRIWLDLMTSLQSLQV